MNRMTLVFATFLFFVGIPCNEGSEAPVCHSGHACGMSLLQAHFGVQSAASAAASQPPNANPWTVPTAGLSAWYQHENVSATAWPSSVGGFATKPTGQLASVSSDVPHYLYGTSQSYLRWGLILNSQQFTICTVTKYPADANPRQRTFTADSVVGCNWLVAQWGGQNGVAFGGDAAGWLTSSSSTTTRPWTVMCATNTGVVFVDDCKSIGNGHAGCTGEQVGEPVTNDPTAYWGLHEPSGFAVLEVITWNRALSTGEINNALGYLNYVVDQSSSGCTNTAPATTTTTRQQRPRLRHQLQIPGQCRRLA